jgi:hypothetical protein
LRNHVINFIRDNFVVAAGQPVRANANALQQFQTLPPAPGLFIGREEGLRELKRRLAIASSGRKSAPTGMLAVVRGWPGVGKSSAAAALAYDAETRQTFPDGILWASLGQKPSLLSELAKWGRALGIDDLLKASTLKEATPRLAAMLSRKRMLLIVDDLWEIEHAVPFQQAQGSQCALLFTTRETKVAEGIAPARDAIYPLPVLSEESSLELLELLAPSVVADNPKECRELVRDVEFLPLALQVAGRTLNAEEKLGWGVKEMLAGLRSGTDIIKVYYNGEAANYYVQFYSPYSRYPGPIFAIPGNHDGQSASPDQASLAAFVNNFCAVTPNHTPEAREVLRQAMTQPTSTGPSKHRMPPSLVCTQMFPSLAYWTRCNRRGWPLNLRRRLPTKF